MNNIKPARANLLHHPPDPERNITSQTSFCQKNTKNSPGTCCMYVYIHNFNSKIVWSTWIQNIPVIFEKINLQKLKFLLWQPFLFNWYTSWLPGTLQMHIIIIIMLSCDLIYRTLLTSVNTTSVCPSEAEYHICVPYWWSQDPLQSPEVQPSA